jgi:filamentous hemagglutinin family protein
MKHSQTQCPGRVFPAWTRVSAPFPRSLRLAAFAGLGASVAFFGQPLFCAASPTLPAGGQVVSGAATFSQSGTPLTVTQTSARAATNWQSFNIGVGKTVNFVQPSASAVSLNRVVGNDVSVIQGALNANGHVFLLNPNGVLFTPTAQVNVGGIIASTLRMNTEDFMAGRYRFEGAGSGTVVNQGNITTARGGYVGLIAAKVTNTGTIVAPEGAVLVGACNRVTLDLGGPIKIQVEEGVLDALIEQGGGIRADGGLVYLTAKAVGEVTRTVINHTGITEARTLAAGKDGKIYLMGGMENDRIVVGGKLDASAPNGGNGGFIETSAAHVRIADDVRVTTAAPKGKTGAWLIDPEDFTITEGSGERTTSSIGATTLGLSLRDTDVTIQTSALTGGNGDIKVVGQVVRATAPETILPATTLTLAADRDVVIGVQFATSGGILGADRAPLNIVIAARARGGDVGYIRLFQRLVSYGGNITLGGGDLAASGFAVGHDNLEGVMLSAGSKIDATGGGSSLVDTPGKIGERHSDIPTGSSGGNIVIRGRGAPTAQTNGSGIYLAGNFGASVIVTAGNGSINLEGYGGNSTASNLSYSARSAGIHIGPRSYIKAGSGNITLKGYQGSGNRRFGISTYNDLGEGGYPVFVGSNGAVTIEGDSLAILDGNLGLHAGLASAIKAPIIGGNTGRAFILTKTGAGALTLSGNATAWGAPDTNATATNGVFSSNNTVLLSGVTAAQAFYAFGVRPDSTNAATQVYLRLNTGLSSLYGNTPVFTYSLYDASTEGNLISSELANPSGTVVWIGGPTAGSSVGSYSLTYGSGIELGSSSYLLNAGAAVSYTIIPRPITIKPDAQTKVYGTADPVLTYSVTGGRLFEGDRLSGSLVRAAGDNVGSYLISTAGLLGLETNSNYAITGEDSLLTITGLPTTVSAAVNGVYVVPPVVSRPASAQLNVGLQLVDAAPASGGESGGNTMSAGVSVDPAAAAKRAPGMVLVVTGGIKRAPEDKGDAGDKKAAATR